MRYVQVESDRPITIEELEGRVVFSDVDLSGGFECSNPTFNRIHELVHWTVTNGLFGIPLDCLHREHWAWTDPATIASSLYPRKHMPRFWTKWLDDIKDAQLENGSVPDICPNYVQRDDPDPAWGGNYPILVWYLYQYFDDSRILEEHYDAIRPLDRLSHLRRREPTSSTKATTATTCCPAPDPVRKSSSPRRRRRPCSGPATTTSTRPSSQRPRTTSARQMKPRTTAA